MTLIGTLTDYKVSSVWAIRDGAKHEWIEQLNCYAHLARHHGYAVDRLQVVVILRDWRKGEALRSPDYPRQQVAVLDVPLWTPEEAQAFMEARVQLHQTAETELPRCTDDERWRRPDLYAVMKEGRKTAVRVLDTEDDARCFIGGDPKLSVVLRKGTAVRCASYCPVANFCTQFQEEGDDGDARSE